MTDALKPKYDPTFLKFVDPVLRSHMEGFNGFTTFEVHLDPQFVACPFEPFPKTVVVWYHYGDVSADSLSLLLLGWLPEVL